MSDLCNIKPIAPLSVADVVPAHCLQVILLPVGGTSFQMSSGNLTDE
jgi:hypothetical protein